MKFDLLNEWKNFEIALQQELKATPFAEFELAWLGVSNKTQFYKKMLPKVAARLGYEHQHEFLLCDHVFLNKDHVPMIFIESENSHPTAIQEINKLCTYSAPVKVLFISCSWADSERGKYLQSWKDRIATHHEYREMAAVYVIVVGEWGRGKPKDDGVLRYYIESFDNFGMEIHRTEIVLSVSI